MVCVYCGNKTAVINSRLQKQINNVWRRRQCTKCQAIFSTLEHMVYENTLVVQDRLSHIMPFQREVLFLSIYDACKHRPKAISDASALTDTVLSKLQEHNENNKGLLTRDVISKTAADILKTFDNTAYVHYFAFHTPS